MKFIESIKLRLRADKYKRKNDPGGIAYVIASVREGQTVLDIGAHKAGYLYHILNGVGEQGRVYAFEPQSNLYNYIKKLKERFRWDNVTIEHLALSDSTGKVTLYIPAKKSNSVSSPGASIVKHLETPKLVRTENVSTETLDAYCHRNGIRPDFLKIDVEGNELKIFQGGKETLLKYKPKIIVEIEARHVGRDKVLETFQFMESLGYTGHFIHGLIRLPLSEFSIEKNQNTEDMQRYCNNFTFE